MIIIFKGWNWINLNGDIVSSHGLDNYGRIINGNGLIDIGLIKEYKEFFRDNFSNEFYMKLCVGDKIRIQNKIHIIEDIIWENEIMTCCTNHRLK